MPRISCRALALAAACLAGLPPAQAQTPAAAPTALSGVPNSNIFDPNQAPIIIIRIGAHRIAILIPRTEGSSTSLNAAAIENKPNNTSLNSIIASSVAGAATAPSGEIHIRGSHGQYSYYLDGAPLPSNVSGSFSDLINPKDIENLRVYTGGFPAEYGGQLAAIFDVTAKAGQGKPNGFIQQIAQTFSAYQTTAQYGGGNRQFSYFLSGIRDSTNFRLSPLTEEPLHNAGLENVGFGKFDLNTSATDRLTLDIGTSGATIQVPNEESRQEVGQDDIQKENGGFANLIFRRLTGPNTLRVAFYSHDSQLRYFGSPQDLLPDPGSSGTSQLTTTNENQTATYLGLRTDYSARVAKRHQVQVGFDADTVSGHQFFNSFGVPQSDPTQDQPTILDDRHISGGDKSIYAQDDWTPGRFLINYG
ncbi:MAG: TonB-dependent receptor, partial [Armatimonadota bacterium]|nr:TonB-dependent receptor [Armatimonadota bacterium]